MAIPTEIEVREALKCVHDPEIPVNVVDLGLIYFVEFPSENMVKVKMTLTAVACPAADQIIYDVRKTVKEMEGIEDCEVELVWNPQWEPAMATEDGRMALGALGIGGF